jgi:cytochrome d ubiquinol oxidase subunit I
MAVSLGFHIVFAAVGIGMPLLMVAAEGRWLRTGDAICLELARRWSRGTAVLFAIGAVSGTVLSFELGLLWPEFMAFAGGIFGLPFALEGFAFFTEAIFLGIYLYGWGRIAPAAHWIAGVVVALSGVASGIFVVTANAWMNAPTGFELAGERPVRVDPIAAMLNPASLQQVVHMALAAYVATGFVVAGIHAFFLLRDPRSRFHRRALAIALAVAGVATPLQLVSGDFLARMVANRQPAKFAAMEAHYRTATAAALIVGGIPDDDALQVRYGVRIPYALSLLAAHDPWARVPGLEEVPRDEWPPTRVVHWAFDVMVASGIAMLGLVVWAGWLAWRRRRLPDRPWLLRALVAATPLGFLGIEAGWVVTEVGRQPWIIYKVMRTQDAVTPMPGLAIPFTVFSAVYLLLSVILLLVLRRQFVDTGPRDSHAA